VEDIMDGVEVVFHPYTLLNNQLFIESGWKYVMNNEEAREFGLQLGLDDDGSIIGSTEHVLGGGSNTNTNQVCFLVLVCCWNIGHVQ